jgi:hypothetical protein
MHKYTALLSLTAKTWSVDQEQRNLTGGPYRFARCLRQRRYYVFRAILFKRQDHGYGGE